MNAQLATIQNVKNLEETYGFSYEFAKNVAYIAVISTSILYTLINYLLWRHFYSIACHFYDLAWIENEPIRLTEDKDKDEEAKVALFKH